MESLNAETGFTTLRNFMLVKVLILDADRIISLEVTALNLTT